MISFKDMTFCEEEECLHYPECTRAWTPQKRQAAERWWKSFNAEGSPPVAFFSERPACFKDPADDNFNPPSDRGFDPIKV